MGNGLLDCLRLGGMDSDRDRRTDPGQRGEKREGGKRRNQLREGRGRGAGRSDGTFNVIALGLSGALGACFFPRRAGCFPFGSGGDRPRPLSKSLNLLLRRHLHTPRRALSERPDGIALHALRARSVLLFFLSFFLFFSGPFVTRSLCPTWIRRPDRPTRARSARSTT